MIHIAHSLYLSPKSVLNVYVKNLLLKYKKEVFRLA